MGGNPPDVCETQQLWGQRALATSRTQQSANKEQWELIIENGNAHARAIADLRQELELLQREVGQHRGELSGCSGSVARLDRLITQQTQRMIDELQADMESNVAHLEKKCLAEVQMLENHVVVMVDNKLKQQQELLASQEQEQRCSSEVYIQDMLRRFGATIKEQDMRATSTQDHLERLEKELPVNISAIAKKELRAFMKEHDTGVVSGKDELRRFCTAVKAGLDARVTCLHERVADFEKGLDAHVDWVQGELRQLHAWSLQEAQGAAFRERFEKELDTHVDWVQGELRQLNASVKAVQDERVADLQECELRLEHNLNGHVDFVKDELRQLAVAVKAEQDARAACNREWAGRLEEQLQSQASWVQAELNHIGLALEDAKQEGQSREVASPEWTARFEKELDTHVGWVRGELQHLSTAVKEVQDAKELVDDMGGKLFRLQEDLKGHWHKMSVTEHVQCGPAEPPPMGRHTEPQQRLPTPSTGAAHGTMTPSTQSTTPWQREGKATDNVVVSGVALFESTPGRLEVSSVVEAQVA
mmetsp:Transcript_47280/g.109412  ORF Transcript_47280/g.109412 Transcript_47280/m.109412 type:complete len:533 (-) Transcript_47280:85-1683(-)